jgi:hypothetical protein
MHAPHWIQLAASPFIPAVLSHTIAFAGQTFRHVPQPVHAVRKNFTWFSAHMPSGLEHHLQRIGHPLKKTKVRMPGPSWSE